MAYIGTPAVDRFTASKAASVYSGDGSTTAFTLEHAVGSDEDILVSVDGVVQEPSVAYAVSSGTTLTFTAAPSTNSGNNIFVYYLFSTLGTVTHPATSALSATSGTFTGAITGGGLLTTGGNIVIPNAGNIGSASDTDAMAISSGGVVTFSQAPVGAGSMIKLYDQSAAGVASVIVDSTIINSTYDNYYIIFDQVGATDGQYLAMRLAVGGTVQTGSSYYGYETQRVGGSYGGANQNTSNYFAFFSSASLGNATGEGVQAWAIIQNVNSTVRPCSITGLSTFYHTDAAPNHSTFGGSVTIANRTSVVNGIQFLMDSGNIAQANFKIYGIK